MISTGSFRGVSGRTSGAEAFLASVEVMAKRGGYDAPGLNHWILAACARQFLARTVLLGVNVAEASAQARTNLDNGTPGGTIQSAEILAIARQSAADSGDLRVYEWHVVNAVFQRAGLLGLAAAAQSRATPAIPDTATKSESLTANPGQTQPSVSRQDEPATAPIPSTPESSSSTALRLHLRPRAERRPVRAQATPMLDECGIDLTAMAASGDIGPVVGRDQELAQIIETLCRPTKANPLLVGEPGVGKSALVEGLARRIAAAEVPALLVGRRVVALNMAALLKESRYYGKLEERLAAVIAEARAVRAILFIDESHAIVAAGGREGSGDVATLLKPALARGDLAVIGATTDDEYRRVVAADAALERRFVVIRVQEPSADAVRHILRAVRDSISMGRGVWVEDAALDHVLAIASARMPHRHEPDRTKDLLEQAVAGALSRGKTTVDRAAVEAAADALVGMPAVDGSRLVALEAELQNLGLLTPAESTAFVERLGITLTGLQLRPERPRAVVLVVEEQSTDSSSRLASTLAQFAFGAPDRVVAINVGSITEPSMISGLLGTSQGYVGYDAALPIHEVAQKPFCVVRIQNVADCHPIVRAVIAKAISNGFISDATGRRIYLSSAILLLEVSRAAHSARRFGFGAQSAPAQKTALNAGSILAPALVGDELAAEIDLVVTPPLATSLGCGELVERLIRQLAARYLVAGVELSWEPAVEQFLVDGATQLPTTRLRESHVEEQVGRAVRPSLVEATRPMRLTVAVSPSGLRVERMG
jgi:ATP-dependent Clp protease ATP-binding subunit ClpC